MAKEVKDLSALRTQVRAAKAALAQATAALGARSEEFAKVWASYSNLVRALTTDEALRSKHGVKSPGSRKGPMFRRAKRVGTAVAPAAAASTPVNGVTKPAVVAQPS
jgi:hypothetical protein